MFQLPDEIKVISHEQNKAVFEIAPLMPGYGATIANPLRRALLSSLEGAAVTSIKIAGVDHEFTSVSGVQEDVIQLILNIKKIRFKMFTDGPVTVSLNVKGEKEVTAGDIKLSSDLELVNPEQVIATLSDKKTEFSMELTVEKGVGYVPAEQRAKEKLPIGVIAIDAIFSPVRLVNFKIDDIRVGNRIDFNKVTIEVETDGSILPHEAMRRASDMLIEQFKTISAIQVPQIEVEEAKPKKSKKS